MVNGQLEIRSFPRTFFFFFSLSTRVLELAFAVRSEQNKKEKKHRKLEMFSSVCLLQRNVFTSMVPLFKVVISLRQLLLYIFVRVCVCVSLRVVFQHRNSCTRGGGTGGRASFDPTKTRSFLSSRVRKKYECSNKIFEKYVRSVRRQNVQDCALHSTNQVFLLGNCN